MNKKNNQSGGIKLFFAKHYSKILKNPQFVGICGSYSKSTTAAVCKEVLSQKFLTVYFEKDIRGISDLSGAVLKIPRKTQKVILDLVLDAQTEVDDFFKLIKFNSLIITSLDLKASTEVLNLTNISQDKLIESLTKKDSLIINFDDHNLRKLIETKNIQPIFFGTDQTNCHVWAGNIRIINYQTVFELNYGVERVEVKSKFLGKHQIYPLLAAASLGIDHGLTLGIVKKALESMEPKEHHFKSLLGFNDCVVIDDTYHPMGTTIFEALDTLNLLPARRRVVVFSEVINYQGKDSENLKEIARKIYKDRVDLVFLGGSGTTVIADELLSLGFIPERLQSNLQNPQITSQLLKILAKGDVVLIKGSQATKLSEVVKKVTKT